MFRPQPDTTLAKVRLKGYFSPGLIAPLSKENTGDKPELE